MTVELKVKNVSGRDLSFPRDGEGGVVEVKSGEQGALGRDALFTPAFRDAVMNGEVEFPSSPAPGPEEELLGMELLRSLVSQGEGANVFGRAAQVKAGRAELAALKRQYNLARTTVAGFVADGQTRLAKGAAVLKSAAELFLEAKAFDALVAQAEAALQAAKDEVPADGTGADAYLEAVRAAERALEDARARRERMQRLVQASAPGLGRALAEASAVLSDPTPLPPAVP